MNYQSQLRGWATDRALELAKINGEKPTVAEIIERAEQLIAYAYIEREDLEDAAKHLFELVRNAAPEKSSVGALIGTLTHIKQDRIRQGIDKAEGAENE